MIEQTPTLATLPQRGTGIWDYISPSRLGLWLKCPLAFRARYIDGIASPTTPAMFVGKCVHSSLEAWYRPRLLNIPIEKHDVIAQIDQVWDAAVTNEDIQFKVSRKKVA